MPESDRPLPDLDQLSHFAKAVEYKSLTAAARACGAAQSVFSRQVSALEQTLGGRLLHRTGRGVEPTELGARVFARAQALLSDAQALVEDATGRWQRPAGPVSVGIVPSLVRPLASRLFNRLRAEHPDVTLRLHEAYSGEVEAMLADGRIDVGIFNRYGMPASKGPRPVMTAPICLVGAIAQRPAGKAGVRLSALSGLPLVLPQRPNGLRTLLEHPSTRSRCTLDVVIEADSASILKEVVVHGGLYTLLPSHAVATEVQRGDVFALPITHPRIAQHTLLDTTRRRPASAAVREVERLLRELLSR